MSDNLEVTQECFKYRHLITVVGSTTELDPDLIEAFTLAFNFANEMGLNGTKAYDFYMKDNSKENPLSQKIYMGCKISCPKEDEVVVN